MMPNTLRSKSETVKAAAAEVERLSAMLQQRLDILNSYGAESPQNARDQYEKTLASVALGEATDEDLAAARRALAEAESPQSYRNRYENMLASVALGEASNEDLAEARRALADAESSHRKLEEQRAEDAALAAGVKRRLTLAQEALEAAEFAFSSARIELVNSELDKADSAYVEYGKAAASAAVRVEALRAWLKRNGQPIVGLAPGIVDVVLRPLSTNSFKAACDANPGDQNSLGEVWQKNIFPRVDSASAAAALDLELSDASSSGANDPAGAGLFAGAKRLARKLGA